MKLNQFEVGDPWYIYPQANGTLYEGPIPPPPEDTDEDGLIVTGIDYENGVVTVSSKSSLCKSCNESKVELNSYGYCTPCFYSLAELEAETRHFGKEPE